MAKKKPIRRRARNQSESPIVSRLALKIVRLIESASLLRLTTGALPKQSKVEVQTGFGRSTDSDTLGGELLCEVVSQHDDETEPSIVIRCKYQLIYTVISGNIPTEKDIKTEEQSITAMVTFQAWPFVREHFHSMSLKMGLPPLTLQPFIISPLTSAPGTLQVSVHPAQK